jgi:tetratricopeptide (TPR) repeat protein
MVEQTYDQARRMGAPRALALCRCFGGALEFQLGRWKEAESSLREAVALYRDLRAASGDALSQQRLGVLLTAKGQLDQASRR